MCVWADYSMCQRLGIVHVCTLVFVHQDVFMGGCGMLLSSCVHDLALERRVLCCNNLLVLVSY